MSDAKITADNHYVPQGYLKQWATNGGVWTYRLLVQHPNVPQWVQKSPVSLGSQRHLYTEVEEGNDLDELERWFNQSFETPSAESIRKVVEDDRLTPEDWDALVRFLAAQDLRTPKTYFEMTARWSKTLPALIENTLADSLQKVTELTKAGIVLPPPAPVVDKKTPFRVKADREAGKIESAVLNGRRFWLRQIKDRLETTAKVLHQHRWTILAPPKGLYWPTSDSPVINLRAGGKGYRLERAWGLSKMNIMMPLSPRHLLFTQVGDRPPRRGSVLDLGLASLVRRVTAENAFRFIFTQSPDDEMSALRPRRESAEDFKAEQKVWADWHKTHSDAEKAFDEV